MEDETSFMIIMGIICFFLVEKFTHQYLAHDQGDHQGHAAQSKVNETTKGKDKNGKAKAGKAEDLDKKIRFQSFAIVSMMGDFIHNFTDGLSIGVAYQANYKLGLTTTVAMFFHEIPHEVGDFALLTQLNYSLV